jgi:hypothetical protein
VFGTHFPWKCGLTLCCTELHIWWFHKLLGKQARADCARIYIYVADLMRLKKYPPISGAKLFSVIFPLILKLRVCNLRGNSFIIKLWNAFKICEIDTSKLLYILSLIMFPFKLKQIYFLNHHSRRSWFLNCKYVVFNQQRVITIFQAWMLYLETK